MKKSTLIITSLVFALCAMSCGRLSGPSAKDVMVAVDPALDGFVSVPIFQENMVDEFQYNDTVEMFDENEDRTITQNASFSVDLEENILWGEGVCSFDNFLDNRSGYTINGTITYSMSASMDKKSNAMDLEFIFDLTYEGGNIQSIAFTINDEMVESDRLPELIVNGKRFQYGEEIKNDVFRFVKIMNVI